MLKNIVFYQATKVVSQYDDNNVILLTFPEHAMIHYLRYLEYGKVQDFRAYKIMTGDLNEETRRKTASLAGKIGGTISLL